MSYLYVSDDVVTPMLEETKLSQATHALGEQRDTKIFMNLDTGNVESRQSPLDLLANTALELSTSTMNSGKTQIAHAQKALSGSVLNMKENVRQEVTKSPRKMKALGKENSPRKSNKKNQSLPSFASLAYTMVLSNQSSKSNIQNEATDDGSVSARHVMPPVPSRQTFPVPRRRLPIQSPSFKVWGEVKPSSVIHPKSPFLRTLNENSVKVSNSDMPIKKRVKKMLQVAEATETKANEQIPAIIKEEAEYRMKSDVTNNDAMHDVIVESNISADTRVVNFEEMETVPEVKPNVESECQVTNSILKENNVKDNHASDIERCLLSDKCVTVKQENSAKPKIWNPLFHSPKKNTCVPLAKHSSSEASIPETCEISSQPPPERTDEFHQESKELTSASVSSASSRVLQCNSSSSNTSTYSLVQTFSATPVPKESAPTQSQATESAPVHQPNKSVLHKFSIDSILSKDFDKSAHSNVPPTTTYSATESRVSPTTSVILTTAVQQVPRSSVIVAPTSALPFKKATEVPVANQFPNINVSSAPIFNLANASTLRARLCATSGQPSPMGAGNLKSIMTNPIPPRSPSVPILRSYSPTISVLGTWHVPGQSQPMVSTLVKTEPEVQQQQMPSSIRLVAPPVMQAPTQIPFVKPQMNSGGIKIYDENRSSAVCCIYLFCYIK